MSPPQTAQDSSVTEVSPKHTSSPSILLESFELQSDIPVKNHFLELESEDDGVS